MSQITHDSNDNPRAERSKSTPLTQQQTEPVKVVLSGPEAPGYVTTPSMQHEINHVAGLADIEASLDWIAKGINRLTSDDFTVNLALAQGSDIYPTKLTLAENDFDDTMDRLITAVERIADSLARLAGLNRPRLESWHEQCEYEPRFKERAVDGGAAGPRPAPEDQQS